MEVYRNGETVWELEPGFLRIGWFKAASALAKIKCVICQIEQAWCFPQQQQACCGKEMGAGGGDSLFILLHYSSL